MKLPTIEILFQKLASTLVARSERGVAILLVKDDTDASFSTRLYQSERDLLLDKARYTVGNYQQLADVITFAPAKLYAVRVGLDETVADALEIVAQTIKTGWVTFVGEASDDTTLIEWVKTQRTLNQRTYKGIVSGAVTPDSKYIVNLSNEKVTFRDDRKEQAGKQYLPSLLGILAACNIERGATSFVCSNLSAVKEPADVTAALSAGKLTLVNDFDEVRVGLGINSMTTIKDTESGDMQYIDIVEAMDLIEDDIRTVFKDRYQGVYKNNLDNQMLFISAVNTYFASLAGSEVLDGAYQNQAQVNVAAQRAAWAKIKPEADTWDDATVRNTTYKRDVFLSGDIKILGAMENLSFPISLF